MIDRRTFLRATGVSLGLPFLESMVPVFGRGRKVIPPQRMVFMCTALGLHPPKLWPKTGGKDYEMTPYLSVLKEHRDQFTLFSGLQHEDQTGRQPHDSEKTWLTAARKPGMSGFRNSISVDQVAATHLGNVTRFSSISLGTAKRQSQSYTSGGVMIPAEISPANLFANLFLEGKPSQVKEQKLRLEEGKSILDELRTQAKQIRNKASRNDNHLLDDYFESVRSAESNITAQQGWLDVPKPQVNAEAPTDNPNMADIIGRLELLIDLIPLIVQTDSSRVISLMVQDHYVVPEVEGVSGNHHNLSHHGQDDEKIEQLAKIELAILNCLGRLLGKMKTQTESGSTLLDSTSIMFGSNLGNANAHHANNLPIILAGGGFNHGQFIKRDQQPKPLCNLFVTMLQNMGLGVESFGQSDGTLSW